MHPIFIGLTAIAAIGLLNPATAPALQQRPDATIELSGRSAGAGVGVNWSNGTLVYKGKKYPVSITGVDVGAVGVDQITASGKVYNLKSLADFDGNYVALEAGATVGGGADKVTMKNQHGVSISLVSTTRGAKLTLGTGGANAEIMKK